MKALRTLYYIVVINVLIILQEFCLQNNLTKLGLKLNKLSNNLLNKFEKDVRNWE